MSRHTVLLDGGFVIHKLQERLKRFPLPADIIALAATINADASLSGSALLRNYFYHARPLGEAVTHPVNGNTVNFATSHTYKNNTSLLDHLEVEENFAVRYGDTVNHGWKIGSKALKDITRKPREITDRDIVPHIQQKGVDLRIGLDMARISLSRNASTIVVVSGDSDLVPAFNMVRTEGVRLYLVTLGHGVRREMKVHVDRTLSI